MASPGDKEMKSPWDAINVNVEVKQKHACMRHTTDKILEKLTIDD